jgi:hypothetical protein
MLMVFDYSGWYSSVGIVSSLPVDSEFPTTGSEQISAALSRSAILQMQLKSVSSRSILRGNRLLTSFQRLASDVMDTLLLGEDWRIIN